MRNYREAVLSRADWLPRMLAGLAMCGAVACSDPNGPPAPATPSNSAKLPAGPLASGAYNNFYNVKLQPEGLAVNFYFGYIGTGTPIVSVGTSLNVYDGWYRWAPATSAKNGYWSARVTGLMPGHTYFFRIDDLVSTWNGSFKTLRRQLIVDVDKVHIDYDGDEVGCGEMIFRTQISRKDFDSNGSTWWTKWHENVCSGGDLYLSDAEGRYVVNDWTANDVWVSFGLLESDSCYAWEYWCGDTNYGSLDLYYDVTKDAKSYTFKLGSYWSNSKPRVVWEGTVKTTFVP